jgi:hypothetical protein
MVFIECASTFVECATSGNGKGNGKRVLRGRVAGAEIQRGIIIA